MSASLQSEIQQTRPFTSLEQETALNILRTADVFTRAVDETLRPYGLTNTQYNVLRILRGAGREGANCGQISERLIHRDPDITRLLDRMVRRGWVRRERDPRDRRAVQARITPAGRALLRQLESPMQELERRLFRGLKAAEMKPAIAILEAIRANV